MSAAKLYTPQVLSLATSLAAYPWDESLPLKGDARSKSCGSTVALGIATDADGRIERIALRCQACAIGQAAAAIFAGAAAGCSPEEVRQSEAAMADWLGGTGEIPAWPGLDAIAPARDYPARHSAILLAWQAARRLLSSP